MKEAESIKLPTATRLKLARGILERTCEACGAGYLLIVFVPGTDLVLRSFAHIDTPEECKAMSFEVAALMAKHDHTLSHATPPPAPELRPPA